MTAWDPGPTMRAIKALLQSTTFFPVVIIGEPFSPPEDTTAAIILRDWDPASAGGSGSEDVWSFFVRLYYRADMATPEGNEKGELALALGVSQIATALAGHYTLGGTVRAINWAGEASGATLNARWGYLPVGGAHYRIVDITVPVIVDSDPVFIP